MVNLFKNFIIKVFQYYKAKQKFSKKCRFSYGTMISLDSEFEGMNQVHAYSSFRGKLGYGSYIGPNSRVSACIGRFTSIGDEVKTISGTHPYKFPYVSTAPCFYVTNPFKMQNGDSFVEKDMINQYRFFDSKNRIDVSIGNDCWIGSRVLIIGGVSIGDGAVVLAGAVVSKSVPPYAVVGGVPAKVLGYRYDKAYIDFFNDIQWWNRPVEWLKNNADTFLNIDAFRQRIADDCIL